METEPPEPSFRSVAASCNNTSWRHFRKNKKSDWNLSKRSNNSSIMYAWRYTIRDNRARAFWLWRYRSHDSANPISMFFFFFSFFFFFFKGRSVAWGEVSEYGKWKIYLKDMDAIFNRIYQYSVSIWPLFSLERPLFHWTSKPLRVWKLGCARIGCPFWLKVPQRRSWWWSGEFMINVDGYGFVPCITCPTSCPRPTKPHSTPPNPTSSTITSQ